LAVVCLEYFYGLPRFPKRAQFRSGPGYVKKVYQSVATLADRHPSGDLIYVLHQMLRLDPWERPVAEECLPAAKALNEINPKSSRDIDAEGLLAGPVLRASQSDDPTMLIPSSEIRRYLRPASVRRDVNPPAIWRPRALDESQHQAAPEASIKALERQKEPIQPSKSSSGRRSKRPRMTVVVASSGRFPRETEMVQLLQEYLRNGSPSGNSPTPGSRRKQSGPEDGYVVEWRM